MLGARFREMPTNGVKTPLLGVHEYFEYGARQRPRLFTKQRCARSSSEQNPRSCARSLLSFTPPHGNSLKSLASLRHHKVSLTCSTFQAQPKKRSPAGAGGWGGEGWGWQTPPTCVARRSRVMAPQFQDPSADWSSLGSLGLWQ